MAKTRTKVRGLKKKGSKKLASKPRGKASRSRPAAGASVKKGARIQFRGKGMREVAALVAAHLTSLGYDPVLIGRACASFYGGASIKPKEIEFIIRDYSVADVSEAMAGMGYSPSDDRTFANSSSSYDVVLSPGPLAVGDDIITKIGSIRALGKSVRLLTPTDCVRHRLATYYRWGDAQALEEAVKVALRHKIDLDLIKRWSEWEWASDRFGEFMRELGE